MFKRPNPLFLFILILFFSHQAWSSVGTIVLATGEVEIQRADQLIEAKTGSSIFEQDKILTRDNARAQLRFSDNTVITLGRNTEFGVETFLNEGSNQAEAKFNIAKGTFKAITGQIGKAAPDKFKVKTRTATIGIRGTIFSGRVTPEREMIATLSGLIYVIEDQTGLSVEVPAGQFTNIMPGQPPEPPKPLTTQELQHMNEEGESGQTEGGSGEGSENQAGTNDETQELENSDDLADQNDSINNDQQNVDTRLVDQALNAQIEQEIDSQLSSSSSLSVVGWKVPSYLSDYFIQDPCIDCQGEPVQDDLYLGYTFEVSQTDLLGTFDDNVGWGTWEQDGMFGYWVGGTEASAAADHIDSLIQQGGSYSYAGHLLGEVLVNESVEDISASSLGLEFNFATGAINGHVSFSSASTDWNMMIDSGYVESGGFSVSTSGDVNQESAFAYGYMDGKFFGKEANSVGGIFSFGTEGQSLDYYEANGVFKAVKP
ncbi:FecR family protein [Thiomicrospira pelophila]|uniref:FecR family protein n=1 Tax=Thiomicrospira pelophila TaxID=934 RepID=UPI00068DFF20|nr:FecR family protein [Thiomicrospira pelophila]